MPTHKCKRCYTTFAVERRLRIAVELAGLITSSILFVFVGYFAGSATIVSDSVVNSVIPQVLTATIASSTSVTNVAILLLGMFVVAGLLVIGAITKRKTIICAGLGYVAGFLVTAWILNAWWTIVIEVSNLVLLLAVYAMLSE
jgi:hypothetical protein